MLVINKCEVITNWELAKNTFLELRDIFPIKTNANNGTPIEIHIDNKGNTTTHGAGSQFRTILNYDPYQKKFTLTHLNNKIICIFELETLKQKQ